MALYYYSRKGLKSRSRCKSSLYNLFAYRRRNFPFWRGGAVPEGADRTSAARENERRTIATLVQGGQSLGISRVKYYGINLGLHLLLRDFFITIVNLETSTILLLVAGVYLLVFFLWSIVWILVMKFYPECLSGDQGQYSEAVAFSVITQMTIGYGNTNTGNCLTGAWLVAIQCISALLLEALTIGIVFARISHPRHRGSTIFISDKAVIARRDGLLKFMVRIADVRDTQVVEPKVKVYMYTWGQGRTTAEGERIPVRVEPLDVDYIDGMLLLPLIIEHTVDERSPLCGHTLDSLSALGAEIIVTFEGTTEIGNPFMARRSYIPTEIYWGHQFKNIIQKPSPDGDLFYEVNLEKFHEVEPQKELPRLIPNQVSQLIVSRAKKTVPYPLLGENTLVLSDVMTVEPGPDGNLILSCRVGDTYPNQMLEVTARMYLYRWEKARQMKSTAAEGQDAGGGGGEEERERIIVGDDDEEEEEEDNDEEEDIILRSGVSASLDDPYSLHMLSCGYETGADRLFLRLPVHLSHVIDDRSPLAHWRYEDGMARDIHSEIVVVVNAYMYANSQNRLRQRTYRVDHHVRYGHVFEHIVRHPTLSTDRKPRVKWNKFHDTHAIQEEEKAILLPRQETLKSAGGPRARLMSYLEDTLSTSAAPESHAALRAFAPRLPAQPSLVMQNIIRNDYTVAPADLARYACQLGLEDASNHGDLQLGQQGTLDLDTLEEQESPDRFVLFPDIAKYALDTTEATDSFPHPAQSMHHPRIPDDFYEGDRPMSSTQIALSRSRSQVGLQEPDQGPMHFGRMSQNPRAFSNVFTQAFFEEEENEKQRRMEGKGSEEV